MLTRGTIDERLRWIFTLYDLNGDGIITRDELLKIINSVHDLMGKFALSSNQASSMETSRVGPMTGGTAGPGGVNSTSATNSGQIYSINSPSRSNNNNQAGSNITLSNEDQAENLFRKFDLNNDGVITLDEFLEACHKVSIQKRN